MYKGIAQQATGPLNTACTIETDTECDYTKNMTNILLVVGLIAVFLAAVVSPRLGGKIQHRTNEKAGWLKRLADWFWDPITWWARKSIELSRKLIVKIAKWGKKTRRKLPF